MFRYRHLIMLWGILGVVLLLASAVFRLLPYALELLTSDLTWMHIISLCMSVLFMAYSEGYKGFQKSFSPRVVARAVHLMNDDAKVVWRVFAPVFCMSYIAAPMTRRVVTYVLTTMVCGLIYLMSFVPQPWRGIVDMGVIVGLSWGILSLFYFLILALRGKFHQAPVVEVDG